MVRTTVAVFLAVSLGVAVNANAQAYNSVTLAWDANSEPDIAGYILYWGTASRSYSQSVDVGNVTQYTINGLNDLQTYYFAVRAYNTDGLQSAYSAEVSKMIPLNPDRVLGVRTRLFWRHYQTGAVAVWHMDGNMMVSGGQLGPGEVAEPAWRIVGTGDFNGDGHTDLLWHHDTRGYLTVWFMAGDTLLAGQNLTPDQVGDTEWRVAAVADFNQDGSPDIVWQHRTQGRLGVWLMRGTTLLEGRALAPDQIADGDWRIVGAGDYDLDGHPDLFWRHEVTGGLSAWRMQGSTMVGGTSLSPDRVADVGWRIVALTDFNGDRRPDLVWQHDDGRLATWIMNGTTMSGGYPLMPGEASTAFRIVGASR